MAVYKFFFILFFFPPIFASPIGSPIAPALLEEGVFISDCSWSCPEFGYVRDYLFQKLFLPRESANRITNAQLRGLSQIGEIAWAIRERFQIQIELGSGEFEWQWDRADRSFFGRAQDGLLWSGDAKLLILEIKDTSLAIDGRAGGWDWMDGPVSIDGIPQLQESQAKLRYWQVGVGVTQKISKLIPYMGVAVNRTRFSISHLDLGPTSFRAKNTVGPFVGCSLTNGSKFFINLEWRGWFEDGLSLMGQVRF